MAEFQVSPLVSREAQVKLEELLAKGGLTGTSLEMMLMAPNCAIASHSLALYIKDRHNIAVEPHVGTIDSMTFGTEPFRHVLLVGQNPETHKNVILDPTALQVLGNAGLTWYDIDKFTASPSDIAGTSDRIFEIYDTPESTHDFVRFLHASVNRARTASRQIQQQLSASREGSQAFLNMDDAEIDARLAEMWSLRNYHPDPLDQRSENFQGVAREFADSLLALE